VVVELAVVWMIKIVSFFFRLLYFLPNKQMWWAKTRSDVFITKSGGSLFLFGEYTSLLVCLFLIICWRVCLCYLILTCFLMLPSTIYLFTSFTFFLSISCLLVVSVRMAVQTKKVLWAFCLTTSWRKYGALQDS